MMPSMPMTPASWAKVQEIINRNRFNTQEAMPPHATGEQGAAARAIGKKRKATDG